MELYQIVDDLESMFPGRPFTLDGHLIGSIGEVLAAHRYGLTLLPASAPTHDAKSPCGKLVQVKATQVKSIGIRAEPEHLLVLKILSDGTFDTVFNGPGNVVWNAAGKMQKNGQRAVSVSKMKALMCDVESNQQLPVMEPEE